MREHSDGELRKKAAQVFMKMLKKPYGSLISQPFAKDQSATSQPTLPTLSDAPPLPTIFSIVLPTHGSVIFTGQNLLPGDPAYDEFRQAGREGNIDLLAQLIMSKKIGSVDVSLYDGRTFLHIVFASRELSPVVRRNALGFCFDSNMTKDIRDHRLHTALHRAAQCGCVESYLSLLRYGFSPYCRSETGRYPIEFLLRSLKQITLSPEEDAILSCILEYPHAHEILYSRAHLLKKDVGAEVMDMILSRLRPCDPQYSAINAFLNQLPLRDFEHYQLLEIIEKADLLGYNGPARSVISG